MPGSPFLGGMFQGFNDAREGAYQQNLKDEAGARAQEAKVYQYLLESRDPEIQSLALSGMMESARPGTKKKGLRGWLGEVQQGEVFPQIKSAMGEMVPDAPAAPATPSGAALPSTTPVHGGPTATPASPTGQPAPSMPGQALSPEAAPAGVTGAAGPSAPAPAAAMSASPAPLLGGPPPGPPPEHPMHRRGTGIPTAEEIAGATEAAKEKAQLDAFTTSLRQAGASDDQIRQAILGRAGAPMRMGTAAAGPMMADPQDPETPIPTLRTVDSAGVAHVTLLDGTSVPPHYVGYVKQTKGLSSMVPDTPAMRQQYGIPATEPKSPTGYFKVQAEGSGYTHQVAEQTGPPAYSGVVTLDDPGSTTGRSVTPVLRGGGTGKALGAAPLPAGEATPDEAEAKGWVAAVDKKIKEGALPGLPIRAGSYDQVTKAVSGGKYQTYQSLQAAAQKSSSAPSATGGSSSVADRIRKRLDSQRGTPPAGPPPPPTRMGGPGPVGAVAP